MCVCGGGAIQSAYRKLDKTCVQISDAINTRTKRLTEKKWAAPGINNDKKLELLIEV